MEKNITNNTNQNKNNIPDTTGTNEHTDMPVKTPATDTKKNTAEEDGLNHTRSGNNEIRPGTTPPADE